MSSALFAITMIAAASGPQGSSFADVTLGETVQQLLVERGDPLRVFDRGGFQEFMYLTPSGNALTSIRIVQGNAVSVAVLNIPPFSTGADRQSALGVRLGDDANVLAGLKRSHHIGTPDDMAHGVGPFRSDDGLDYYFDSDRVVTAIDAHLPAERRATLQPNTMPLKPHTGSSFDDAVIIKADNDDVGVRWEYEFLSYRRCSISQGARIQQALLTHKGKPYDMLTVSNCAQPSADGDYYFDISSFFGKE